MPQTIYVISDLHLGGEAGPDGSPGFRLCTPVGQERLTAFLDWIHPQVSNQHTVHLVINGDLVDFLAERQFASFTAAEDAAAEKLQSIVRGTQSVWEALRRAIDHGVRVTILLGNHDIELSLPAPRRLLLEQLGDGRVELLYDNQALSIGPVLIEHGNRYDTWNFVRHNELRQFRSALTRREPPPEFPPPAGSQLVEQIMNPLKKRYAFVDLLKPENAGAIPTLAVLDAETMRVIPKLAALATKAGRLRFDESGRPKDLSNIALDADEGEDQKWLRLAHNLVAGGDAQNASFKSRASDFWERYRNAASNAARQWELRLLYRGLRAHVDAHRQSFHVNQESSRYLRHVQASVRNGFRVVVYGHTHAVKRVPLLANGTVAPPGTRLLEHGGAVYLNTGTWADLMRFPEAVLSGNEEQAPHQLERFCKDLAENHVDRYREQAPTFAKIEMDGQNVKSADVYLFEKPGTSSMVPDGQLASLIYQP